MKISTQAIAALGIVSIAASLGGCANFSEAIGATKTTPDEFRVVALAPLVVPPEYNLRPPRPGEARPMELRPDMQAQSAVFGVRIGAQASEGERLLVARAGATNADPRIRDILDAEAGDLVRKQERFADRLMGRPTAPGAVADPLQAQAEAERLAAEQAAIRNATGGGAATIQQSTPRGFKLPGM